MAPVFFNADKPTTFNCNTCHKNFKIFLSLKRHVKEKHPEQIGSLVPPPKKSLEFKCEHCARQFSNIKNLRFHMRKMHSEKNEDSKVEYLRKCPLCNHEYPKKEILTHFEQHHNLNLEFQVLNFETLEDFETWKKYIETETQTKFVRKKGAEKSKDGLKYNFECHRSGFYISGGKGLRHLKKQGSCRINGYCPAAIKMQKGIDNSCSVYYCSTHIGHQNDIDHVTTKNDRRLINSEISPKVPLDEIKLNMEPLYIEAGTNTLNQLNYIIVESSENDGKECNISLLEERESLKEKFIAIIDSIESKEHLKIVEDALQSIYARIEAIRSSQISFSSLSTNYFLQ